VLKVAVSDPAMLWHGAAARLAAIGLDAEEIDDTIGPVEDPQLRDCLATLAIPQQLAGCTLSEAEIFIGTRPALMLVTSDFVQERADPSRARTIAENDEAEGVWPDAIDPVAISVRKGIVATDRGAPLPN
jgi:hypothetical protein